MNFIINYTLIKYINKIKILYNNNKLHKHINYDKASIDIILIQFY